MSESTRPSWPPLIRFLLTQVANGAVVGLIFAELLIWRDVGGIGRMLHTSPDSGALTGLIFAQAAILFGTLGMGVAVMTLPRD